jgi:hypothetical protein
MASFERIEIVNADITTFAWEDRPFKALASARHWPNQEPVSTGATTQMVMALLR